MSKVVCGCVVSVVASGCGSDSQLVSTFGIAEMSVLDPRGPVAPLGAVSQTDVIVQTVEPQVDVLWTIDNSGSMEDEQQALVDNFATFMHYFLGSGLDYHIGVVSTDMDDPAHSGALQSGGTPYRFIDTDTPNAVGVFTAMASLGTNGSPVECGLEATFTALETHAGTLNAGFRRDEAPVHTIVVSDEADSTDPNVLTGTEFVSWYTTLAEDSEDRTFSSVVDLVRGTAYTATTAELGGIVWDIVDTAYAQVLDQLGIQAAGLRREFFLSRQPILGTIQIHVEEPDGARFGFASDAWSYDAKRNSVSFAFYVPDELTRIILDYDVAD